MGKRLTISNRFREWFKVEPWWAGTTLASFAISLTGFITHLAFQSGVMRTVGLWVLIIFAVWTQTAMCLRKRWWWATFHAYVVFGVIAWEIASYFFGSPLP